MPGPRLHASQSYKAALMIREVFIQTPENIVFTYRLAGLPTRALAALADLGILGFAVGLVVGLIQLLRLVGGTGGEAGAFAVSVLFGASIALAFAFVFGYFALFEGLWNGQTPGKRLLGIRVVKDRGEAVRLLDAVLRNLLRIADIVPGLYLVAGISVLLSERNKRLGDFAAGTMVVEVDDAPDLQRSAAPALQRFNSLREDARLAGRVRRVLELEDTALIRDMLARLHAHPRLRTGALADLAGHYRDVLDLRGPRWEFLSDEALLADMIDVIDAEDANP